MGKEPSPAPNSCWAAVQLASCRTWSTSLHLAPCRRHASRVADLATPRHFPSWALPWFPGWGTMYGRRCPHHSNTSETGQQVAPQIPQSTVNPSIVHGDLDSQLLHRGPKEAVNAFLRNSHQNTQEGQEPLSRRQYVQYISIPSNIDIQQPQIFAETLWDLATSASWRGCSQYALAATAPWAKSFHSHWPVGEIHPQVPCSLIIQGYSRHQFTKEIRNIRVLFRFSKDFFYVFLPAFC